MANCADLSDEELLAKSQRGDEEAFLVLYQRYRLPIVRFVTRFVGDMEKAKDITHDCFMVLIDSNDRFDASRASLRSYFFGIARRIALRSMTKSEREVTYDELPAEAELGGQALPIDHILEKELSPVVATALASLTPDQRSVLLLADCEDLSLLEICEVVGKDLSAVKSSLHRARERFKKSLMPYINKVGKMRLGSGNE
jgi:RNA polymerase sigma-70 factor, ECF subfamily